MPNTELIEAFARLEASITKQWGEIPVEIEDELDEIAGLINPPASEASPAPDTGTPAAAE